MDDAQRHQVSMGIGIALGVGSIFAPSLIPKFPEWLAVFGMLVAAAFFLWGVIPLLPRGIRFPARGRMPLEHAAQLAFDAFQGTLMEQQARRPANAPDGPLNFMAEQLFMAGLPICGKEPPSTLVRRVPDEVLFSNRFARNGSALQDMHANEITYTELTVSRSEFRDVLAQMLAAKDSAVR
jgi:hypothetical protein